jgi:hypothetical protein
MILIVDPNFSELTAPVRANQDAFRSASAECGDRIGDLGLAVLDGEPPPGIDDAIDMLTVENLPNFRLEGPVALVADWLDMVSQTPGLLTAQAWIVADVASQARRFADMTGTTQLGLKLEVVRDNACRKLHHDYVALRLVCTYRGPGTQWLARDHEAPLGDEREVVPDHWLTSIPRFASGIFAGVLLPGARPILHRSPPIAGTGEIRLVLTINEPFSGRFRGRQ